MIAIGNLGSCVGIWIRGKVKLKTDYLWKRRDRNMGQLQAPSDGLLIQVKIKVAGSHVFRYIYNGNDNLELNRYVWIYADLTELISRVT